MDDMALHKVYESEDAFIQAAKTFGQKHGFNTRKGKTGKAGNKILWREVVCSCEGSTVEQNKNIRNRDSIRTGCKFRVRAWFRNTGNNAGLWELTVFRNEHNHPLLLPKQVKQLAQNRSLPDDVKDQLELFKAAGMSLAVANRMLESQFGKDKCTWIRKDLENYWTKLGKCLQGKEASRLLAWLQSYQEQNPPFFFAYSRDDNDRLKSVFWMFPQQKQNYSQFCDVVLFDNTYKSNMFQMPFGIFTGINNYGQSITFAGCLLRDETQETFEWLFTTFLEAVDYHTMGILFTDGDHVMAKAIQKVC
jgi:hypothetical protein